MIGERLGSWIIDRELGRGGMGHVFLAHDAGALDRQAAIKVLAAELVQDPRFQHRFEREISTLRQLDHPNIVRFFESGAHEGRPYYVMEYVDGPTYEEVLKQRGRLSWQEVLDVARQVCRALKHAHDHGVIHRDLKPANLLRTQVSDPNASPDLAPGQRTQGALCLVKLTDFGIAKVFTGTQLTSTGGLVGTAEYLSPEQASGKPVTKRSDLYSLGVVLYILLTGRLPFEGTNVLDLLHKHRFAQFDRPIKVVPGVPFDLDNLICQLLEKDPARRPADGLVLQRQLDRIHGKLQRQGHVTIPELRTLGTMTEGAEPEPEPSEEAEGPATLMSRLMRRELEEQNRGGLLRRLFNHPWVLIVLFVVTVGVILWTFLRPRPSADFLFRSAEVLMDSEKPEDWERAWNDYLEPLNRYYPDHDYTEQVDQYRQRIDDHNQQRRNLHSIRSAAAMGEAQRFYRKGLSLCKDGDAVAARRVWQELITTFRDVESEHRWVRRAEMALTELERRSLPDEARLKPIQAALRRARELRDQGQRAAAEEIWQSLEDLYHGEPLGRDIFRQIQQDRAR